MVSPELGKKLFDIDIFNARQADKYEIHLHKPVMKITSNGKSIELPILIMPGTHPEVIAMALDMEDKVVIKTKRTNILGPQQMESVKIFIHLLFSMATMLVTKCPLRLKEQEILIQ